MGNITRVVVALLGVFLIAELANCTIAMPCMFTDGECPTGSEGAGGDVGGGDLGGSGSGEGTANAVCDDGVCAEVMAGKCGVTYGCRPASEPDYSGPNKCWIWEIKSGRDDSDCIQNVCVDDEWVHKQRPQDRLDDGDPCTDDFCDPAGSLVHTPKPNCP
jgi:hypothetical protein